MTDEKKSPGNGTAAGSGDDWPFLDGMPPGRDAKQKENIRKVPLPSLLGFRIEEAATDYVKMAVDFRPELTQPAGIMHGGVHAALVDTAVAQAIVTTIKPEFQMVTIHLDTKYFKPLARGTLYAEGRIVRKGKRVVHGEVTLRDSSGETVGSGWCVYAITKAGKR
jgi:acyl-CoA thioesterase